MEKANITRRCDEIDKWVSAHFLTRFLTSHICLSFFYGAFLFLYELHFLREVIPAIHPVLIAWAGMLAAYDLFIRRGWTRWPVWKLLFLFVVSSGISVVLNREAGLVGNIKTWILTVLPLFAFYPVCLTAGKHRKKALILAGLGGAIVLFASSVLALIMYICQISTDMELWGVIRSVGIQLYDRTNPDSGLLLYGFYRDTNHAANFAIIYAAYSLMMLRECRRGIFKYKWQNKLGLIFAAISLPIHLIYFPLANSRGAWLTLIVASMIMLALYFYYKRLSIPKNSVKALTSMALAIVVTAAMCGGLLLVRTGFTRIPDGVRQIVRIIDVAKNPVVDPIQPSVGSQPSDVTEPSDTTEPADTTEPSDTTEPAETATQPPVENPEINEAWGNFEKNNENFGAGRLVIWKDALRLVMEQPLFGQCPGNTRYFAQIHGHEGEMAKGSDIHNSYIDLLIDYGIVGFCLMIGFWCACAWMILKALSTRGKQYGAEFFGAGFVVLMCAGAALLLSCVFINTTAMYFTMMLAVSYLMADWTEVGNGVVKK